jgi:hypothetical protein
VRRPAGGLTTEMRRIVQAAELTAEWCKTDPPPPGVTPSEWMRIKLATPFPRAPRRKKKGKPGNSFDLKALRKRLGP